MSDSDRRTKHGYTHRNVRIGLNGAFDLARVEVGNGVDAVIVAGFGTLVCHFHDTVVNILLLGVDERAELEPLRVGQNAADGRTFNL